jgi:hypothetical protein
LVERPGGYAEGVPRPRRDLSTTEKRHLHWLEGRIARLEAELQATRREWAELVEEAGQAAVARELGDMAWPVARPAEEVGVPTMATSERAAPKDRPPLYLEGGIKSVGVRVPE